MQDAAEAERRLLGLLGQLGMTRAEVYRSVLNDATESLLARVKSGAMKQGALLSLLDERVVGSCAPSRSCARYPSRCSSALNPVPSSYLKNISADIELFRRLPVEVQSPVMGARLDAARRVQPRSAVAAAFDRKEVAAVVRNLECDVALAPLNRNDGWSVYAPGAEPKLLRTPPRPARRGLELRVVVNKAQAADDAFAGGIVRRRRKVRSTCKWWA